MHHLIRCDQGPHRSSPVGFTSQPQSPLPAGDTEGSDCSALRLAGPQPHAEAESRLARTGNQGKGKFLIQSPSLKFSPSETTFYELSQCPFHLLETDKQGVTSFKNQAAAWASCRSTGVQQHGALTAPIAGTRPSKLHFCSSFHLPYSLVSLGAAVLFPHRQENQKIQRLTTFLFILQQFESKSSQKGFHLELHLERVPTPVSPCTAPRTTTRNYIWCNSSRVFFLLCRAR